jgi:hypothetical protein
MNILIRYKFVCFSVLFLLCWFAFIFITSRSIEYYLARSLKEVNPNEVVSFENRQAKIILNGWSSPEVSFRWSQKQDPRICFKPNSWAFKSENSKHRIRISIDVDPVTALVGKTVQFSLLPNSSAGKVQLLNGRYTYSIVDEFNSIPKIVCLVINLPFTVKGGANDQRNLGLKLHNVSFG